MRRQDEESKANPEVVSDLDELSLLRAYVGHAWEARLDRLEEVVESLRFPAYVKSHRQEFLRVTTPLFGPIVREYVSASFMDLLASLNHLVEKACSAKALKLRFLSWKTGVPYGLLVYRSAFPWCVERVLLVDGASGKLLEAVQLPHVARDDDSRVASLLAAVTQFARQTFGVAPPANLRRLELGEYEIVGARCGDYVLAAVVWRRSDATLASRLDALVEEIVTLPSTAWSARLQTLLDAHGPSASSLKQGGRAVWRESLPALVVVAILVIAAASVVIFGWHRESMWERESRRLESTVHSTPGLVPLAWTRDGRVVRATILKDADATVPTLEGRGLRLDDIVWIPFLSDAPDVVERRVRRVLAPPEGVEVRVEKGSLSLLGRSSDAWKAQATILARAIPGILAVDDGALTSPSSRWMRARADAAQRVAAQEVVLTRARLGLQSGETQTAFAALTKALVHAHALEAERGLTSAFALTYLFSAGHRADAVVLDLQIRKAIEIALRRRSGRAAAVTLRSDFVEEPRMRLPSTRIIRLRAALATEGDTP